MDAELAKRRKGRTKNTETPDDRKYECVSCDRKYLSYSALYTHNKIKHGITISTKGIDSKSEPRVETRGRGGGSRHNGDSNAHSIKQGSQTPRNSNGAISLENMSVENVILSFIDSEKRKDAPFDQMIYWVMDQLMICINENCNMLESC